MLFRSFSLVILSSLAVGGCSKYMPDLDKVLPDQRKEYKKSKSLPDLEVPPDLTTESIDDTLAVPDVENGSATFSTYQERVVKQKENRLFTGATDEASITEASGEQLIVVPRTQADTWSTLQQFWQTNNYSLDLDDNELGIMETNWSGDDAAGIRNKFKIFVEPTSEPNRTAIYLSHVSESFEQGVWSENTRNIPLEREAAAGIKNSFGLSSNDSTPQTTTSQPEAAVAAEPAPLRSEIVNAGDGKRYLAVKTDADATWDLVSDFLNNAPDIEVENESVSEGLFTVIYKPAEGKKKGIVSKLAFWKSANSELQVTVRGVGSNSEVTVLDDDGDWKSSDEADLILSRIKSSL